MTNERTPEAQLAAEIIAWIFTAVLVVVILAVGYRLVHWIVAA